METSEKTFNNRQVIILVFCIVAAIAFVETSAPVWTIEFFREFGLKLPIYGFVSEVAVIFLGSSKTFQD